MLVRVRFPVDDRVVDALHAVAFGGGAAPVPWAERLARHSLTWAGAFADDVLVGFAHAVWDGGTHAFLLDVAVHPDHRRQGAGQAVVRAVARAAHDAGCTWLHADYEPGLAPFYASAGFRPTQAGLLRLDGAFGIAPGEQ